MMMMMMMTMMTNIIPYWRTKTHIREKVLMGIWASAVHTTMFITTYMNIFTMVIARRHSVPMICHTSLAVPSSSTITPSSYSLNIITGEYRIIPINIKIKQFCLFDNCYVSKYQNPQMQTNGIKVTPNWSKAKLKKNIKISPKCSAAELSRSVPQLTSRRPSAASSIGIG